MDRCGWDNETISSLIECDKNTSPIPSGHPLLLTDIDVVLGLSKDASLRDNIEIQRIQASGKHMNIDTPQDLEGLL